MNQLGSNPVNINVYMFICLRDLKGSPLIDRVKQRHSTLRDRVVVSDSQLQYCEPGTRYLEERSKTQNGFVE